MPSFIQSTLRYLRKHHIDIMLAATLIIVGYIHLVLRTKEAMETRPSEKVLSAADMCTSLLGKSEEIEAKCSEQSEDVCKTLDCCVFARNSKAGKKGGKCVAGGRTGPTYHTNKDGGYTGYDTFHHKGQCYGSGC